MVILKYSKGATREQLTDLGFRFGTSGDGRLVSCAFPAGWRHLDDGGMVLLDAQRRRRAIAFCNETPTSRYITSIHLLCRYQVRTYSEDGNCKMNKVVVTDCGKRIAEFGDAKGNDVKEVSELKECAEAWLAENYPDWRNPLAYW